MDTTTAKLYGRMRNAGYTASEALRTAKTLTQWEDAGDLVRLRAEPEEENYFSVYGEPEGYTDVHGRYHSVEQERKELEDSFERNGVWCLISEYRASDEDEWQIADTIGMFAGYENPLDPRQNWYVPDLMRSALDALEAMAIAPSL